MIVVTGSAPTTTARTPGFGTEPAFRSRIAANSIQRLSTWQRLHRLRIAVMHIVTSSMRGRPLPRVNSRHFIHKELKKQKRSFASSRLVLWIVALVAFGWIYSKHLTNDPLHAREAKVPFTELEFRAGQPKLLPPERKAVSVTDLHGQRKRELGSERTRSKQSVDEHIPNRDEGAEKGVANDSSSVSNGAPDKEEGAVDENSNFSRSSEGSTGIFDNSSNVSNGDESTKEVVGDGESSLSSERSVSDSARHGITGDGVAESDDVTDHAAGRTENVSDLPDANSPASDETVMEKLVEKVVEENVEEDTMVTGGRRRKDINIQARPQQLKTTLGNGTVYKIPASWPRFHTPWFVPHLTFRLKGLAEARYRVLYSPFRHSMSDGIGHSMAVLNYEIRAAHGLGLACSHRVSNYSSLSVGNARAVEDFFGWGVNVAAHRTELQHHACKSERGDGSKWSSDSWDGRFQCNNCASIRQGNKFGIRSLQEVPTHLSYECVNGTRTHKVCNSEREAYIAKNNEDHTLFQLPTDVCAKPVSDSQFGDTKTYYWHKYWDRHAFPNKHRKADTPAGQRATRQLTLSEQELIIAVHVRRGDFLVPEVRVKRVVLPDETYAALICRALQVVHDEGGVFSTLRIHVHIFSEGQLVDKGAISTHTVEGQNSLYYDFNNNSRDDVWWTKLIETTARKQLAQSAAPLKWKNEKVMKALMSRLSVSLRIAEPTLASMHEMVSSDIFIGSRSGLSINAVWALARGVSLMPKGAPIDSEGLLPGGARERICCTVGYHPSSLALNAAKLREYWHAYAEANRDSVERALAADPI